MMVGSPINEAVTEHSLPVLREMRCLELVRIKFKRFDGFINRFRLSGINPSSNAGLLILCSGISRTSFWIDFPFLSRIRLAKESTTEDRVTSRLR